MFFGVYSMNIVTPFQHSAFAFWIITGFTVSVTLTILAFARKKGIF
jgi:Mg2+ and Co2+ transporter CorA